MKVLWHERKEDLREVRPGDEGSERNHEEKQNLLVSTEFSDVRQQVVKVH